MPIPTDDELRNNKRSEFISRCVPIVKGEGKKLTQAQALGKCYGIWKNYSKEK